MWQMASMLRKRRGREQTSSKNRETRGRLLLPPDLCLLPGLITTSTGNPKSEPRHF